MVHLGFCNVHKVASEPESRLVWNVLDACLRSRETYGKCLSIQLCQTSDKCGQVIILLAMRLHPSCSGDDTPSVMSISHSQTTIQSPGRLDPPPSTLDMESPALQATSVPPPNLHIYACWRCNRTDMKSSGTMVDTPG